MKLAAIFLTLLAIGIAGAQEPHNISIVLERESIRSALFKLSLRVPLDVRYDAAIVAGPVDMDIRDNTLDDAVTKILDCARPRLKFVKEGSTYVVVFKEPVVNVSTRGGPAKAVVRRLLDDARSDAEIEFEDSTTTPELELRNVSFSDALKEVAKRSTPAFEILTEEGRLRLVPKSGGGRPVLVPQPGHTGLVTEVSFSPDRLMVASRGTDEYVNVWSVLSGKTIKSTTGIIGSQAFTADSRNLIAANGTSIFSIEIATNKFRRIGHTRNPISRLAYAPDGNIAVSDDGDEIACWDGTDGHLISAFKPTQRPYYFAIDRSGKRLAFGGPPERAGRPNAITVVDIRKRTQAASIRFDGHPVRIEFVSDGNGVVIASLKGDVGLYSIPYGDLVRTLVPASASGRERWDFKMALADHGTRFAYCDDQRVVIADYATNKRLSQVTPTGNAYYNISALSLDSAGRQVLVARDSGDDPTEKLALYSVGNPAAPQRFAGGQDQVLSLRFSSDGDRLIAIEPKGARLWDPSMTYPPRFVSCGRVTIQPRPRSNEPLVMLGKDPATGQVCAWLAPSGRKIELDGPVAAKNVVESIWSGDGQQIVFRDSTDKISVWAIGSPKPKSFNEPNRPIRRMVTNNDATRVLVLSGKKDFRLTLYNGITGTAIKSWPETEKMADTLAGASHGAYATFVAGGKTSVIEWRNGDTRYTFDGDEPSISANGVALALRRGDRCAIIDLARERETLTDAGQTSPRISADGASCVTFSRTREIAWVYANRTVTKLVGHRGPINAVDVHPSRPIIASAGTDGTVRLWTSSGKEIVQLHGYGVDDYMASLPDNTYMASPTAARNLTIAVGDKTYPFDQFDLRLNRPDLVMASIGLAPSAQINLAREAYKKRLKLMGFEGKDLNTDNQAPREPTLVGTPSLTTASRQMTLHLDLYDARVPLDRLNISVDGVPVFGSGGIPLRDQNKRQIADFPITVPLSAGKNTFRISVLNSNAVESPRLSFIVNRTDSKPVRPNLYVLSVGVSKYPTYSNLELADRDAAMVGKVMGELSIPGAGRSVGQWVRVGRRMKYVRTTLPGAQSYGHVYPLILRNEQATRENILAARTFLSKATVDDVVVLFFAGHGHLDDRMDYYFLTPNFQPDNLANTAINYTDIESLIDGIASRKRLILLDTCNSGQPEAPPSRLAGQLALNDQRAHLKVSTPVKIRGIDTGNRPSDAFRKMHELFSGLESLTGANVISAAVAGGGAQENGSLGNGVMTYALLRAIRDRAADSNRNGEIKVSELRRYIIKKVVLLTNGQQEATSREENAELDFRIR